MSLTIVPVRGRRDLGRFIDVPWKLFSPSRADALTPTPGWTPPLRMMVREALDTKKNPFYRNAEVQLLLAVRDGRDVGRIAAIENRAHNRYHGDRVGFFGFFECADDAEAAAHLLTTAAEWLGERGLDTLRGPVSPSTNHEVGLLVDGFEHPPTIMTPWNPPYYGRLLESLGLAKARDLLAFLIPIGDPGCQPPMRFVKLAERARSRSGLTFRRLRRDRFREDALLCWEIYSEAWRDNWGFVPLAEAEFLYSARHLKSILMDDYALIAEVNGEPVGFILVARDLNEVLRRIPSGRLLPSGLFRLATGLGRVWRQRVILMGVRPRFRRLGIVPLLFLESMNQGKRDRVISAEASWILEDNQAMITPLQELGLEAYRRWRIYDRPLETGA